MMSLCHFSIEMNFTVILYQLVRICSLYFMAMKNASGETRLHLLVSLMHMYAYMSKSMLKIRACALNK